jgi:hypothetical protein
MKTFDNCYIYETAKNADTLLKELDRLKQLEPVLKAATEGRVILLNSGDFRSDEGTFSFSEKPVKYSIEPNIIKQTVYFITYNTDTGLKVYYTQSKELHIDRINQYLEMGYSIVKTWKETYDIELSK